MQPRRCSVCVRLHKTGRMADRRSFLPFRSGLPCRQQFDPSGERRMPRGFMRPVAVRRRQSPSSFRQRR